MGGTTQTLQVDMISAWNMISVPLAVADSRTTTLFPTAISNAFAYNGSYVRRDTLNHPNGYWLKFGSAQTVNLTGSTRLTDTLTVIAGWNMIGSVSSSTPVASIIQQPAGIVASSYYGFTLAGYGAATSVEPGKSYWVKITAPGKLILTH
jgi:hemin uptake protein HemP